jgi:hypothetical protein
MNGPSFAELYRRSRYFSRSRPGEETDKAEMQRLEEFAVAATAFVLQHDAKRRFRNAFLRKVCGLDHLAGEQFEIGVQTDYQAGSGKFDLTLVSKRYAVVVEAKIRAPLDAHQDPHKDFRKRRSGGKIGYGCQMIDKREWKTKALIYVVLRSESDAHEKPRSLRIAGREIRVRFARWCELDGMSDSSMLTSLLEWLGRLRIKGLMEHNFKNMKLAQFMEKAWNLDSLLEAVRSESDLKTRKVKCERDNASIGCDILSQNADLRYLKEFANHTASVLGWFGYVVAPDGKPRLSVWFYAGSEEKAKKFTRRFSNFTPFKEDPKAAVCFQPPNSKGDFRWLIDTLKRLKRRS